MKQMTYLLFLALMMTSLTSVAGTYGDEEEGGEEEEVARVIQNSPQSH